MEEGIFPDGGTPPQLNRPLINPPIATDQRPRIVKANGSNSPEFFPQLRPAGVTKALDLWQSVKDTWTAANATDAQTIADSWTAFMGWTDPKKQGVVVAPPVTAPTPTALSVGTGTGTGTGAGAPAPPPLVSPIPPFTALKAGVPDAILHQFDDYFLGLPQVAVKSG
jgi:hypothetical protein